MVVDLRFIYKCLPGPGKVSFLELNVNVFKEILSIQRFFNQGQYRGVIKKMHCSLCRYTDLSLILVAATTTEFNF